MDCAFMLWLFAVSVAASAFGGMLGMASGIFIVPILTIFGHVEIHTAIGASIVSVIACSCAGAGPFLKSRLTNVRLALVLEVATTMGALSGVLLAGIVPVSYLYFVFAAILFFPRIRCWQDAVILFLSARSQGPASGAKRWVWTQAIPIRSLAANFHIVYIVYHSA